MKLCGRILSLALVVVVASVCDAQELVGIHVVPHRQSDQMRYRRAPDMSLGARVELMVLNNRSESLKLTRTTSVLHDNRMASDLVKENVWAWHDTPEVWLEESVEVPAQSLFVLGFNSRNEVWGVGTKHRLNFSAAAELSKEAVEIGYELTKPQRWLSAVTFLSESGGPRPDHVVVHIANDGAASVKIRGCRLWLPESAEQYHAFKAQPWLESPDKYPVDGLVASGDRACLKARIPTAPLSYVVVELELEDESGKRESLWAHLRLKSEAFDISGGWVSSEVGGRSSLESEEFLKTLSGMHLNTAHIQEVGGYTDNKEMYERYPLKRFAKMEQLDRYNREEMLPEIHAVEFIGEPQYGGGRPIPPQEVWSMLAPYQPTSLATTVTLSEERTWRYYAGVSDYPHYDAYRVVAPAADSWGQYDRWEGKSIRWAAPLETIGEMTRSLRELNRPRPIAYWSQGAHHDWGSFWTPRRGSPTPAELRSQAWQALGNRITSLYWFNLSYKSLMKFPDLIVPIRQVDREIEMLKGIMLSGDAYEYQRLTVDGKLQWDLSSIASPNALLMVANDLAYKIDEQKREFVFEKRPAELSFRVPAWLQKAEAVFRVDGNGVHEVKSRLENGRFIIDDEIEVVGVYVAGSTELRNEIQTRFQHLLAKEESLQFDPGNNPKDLETLRGLSKDKKK